MYDDGAAEDPTFDYFEWSIPAESGAEFAPCMDCAHWSVEVMRHGDDVYMREWHDYSCPALAALNREYQNEE